MMMGLIDILDNWTRDARMDNRRRRDREAWAGEEQSLMTYNNPMPRQVYQPQGLFNMDPWGQSTLGQTPTVPVGGTGYRGGQMPKEAYEVMLSTQNDQAAKAYMERQMMERAAMERQRQEQDWSRNNMSMYDQQRLNQQAGQNVQDFIKDERKFITDANKDHRKVVDVVQKMNTALPKDRHGNLDLQELDKNKARQYQYVFTAVKSIVGNEAVMADNEQNIRLSQVATGAPPGLATLIDQYNNGQLDGGQFMELIKMANDNAAYHDDLIRKNRTLMPEAGQGRLLPYGGVTPPTYGAAAPPPPPAGGTTNMQTPKPVTTRPGG